MVPDFNVDDPIADFINAATADVIYFTAARPFEKFKADTELLNDLSVYSNVLSPILVSTQSNVHSSQLKERGKLIGYEVDKVVFRGYLANTALQDMHNNAIETRTKLVLEQETEVQVCFFQDERVSD